MKTSHLQAMQAVNAARITDIQKDIDQLKYSAQSCKDGIKAYPAGSLYEYFKESRTSAFVALGYAQRKMAKAVELQVAIKAELESNKVAAQFAKVQSGLDSALVACRELACSLEARALKIEEDHF